MKPKHRAALSKFGEIVRVQRTLSRESLSALSSAVGCSPSLMSAIEIGTKPPTVDMALKVAAYYAMNPDYTNELVLASMDGLDSFKMSVNGDMAKRVLALMAIFLQNITKEDMKETLWYLDEKIGRCAGKAIIANERKKNVQKI
jgi:transcriptional regulator with XRE-family HTH domain